MEQNSELVAAGKLLHETVYPQRPGKWRELAVAGIKIDFYEPQLGIVHETKRSRAFKQSHVQQLRYYLLVLRRAGLRAERGILEYPALRRTEEVLLSDENVCELERAEADIATILADAAVPPKLAQSRCSNCSYFDFCHASEYGDQ